MVKNKQFTGLALLEVVIALAISATIFVVVIGTFAIRARTDVDDAARLVMADISKVRNEAQQGLGPSTAAGQAKLQGNELFGGAIEFVQSNCPGANDSCMRIYKLMQTPAGKVLPFESNQIQLSQNLRWFIPYASPPVCTDFTSCYSKPGGSLSKLTDPPISLGQLCFGVCNWGLMLVIRNGTGQTYVKSRSNFITDINNSAFMVPHAGNISDYTTEFQGKLRLSLAKPETTSGTFADQIAQSRFRYYANFDLSVPGNQSFEVVK